MVDFTQISDKRCELIVDISIFNEQVVSKMAYWLSEDYCIYWKQKSENEQILTLEKKEGIFLKQEVNLLKNKVNQLLIDFKNRDIINHETKNIRDILYIKAFANNDDYEDFSLKAE
jgi:His-Xaa-Ser system protein HxsD